MAAIPARGGARARRRPRVAGLLYGRSLHAATNYDEQVYLASLDALTHGQALGTDVYASQPPGFYTLLRAVSLLPGDGVTALRVPFLLIALLGLGAAFAIGRERAGTWGGLGAAPARVAAPYPVQAARIQADTASVVLALCAFAVLLYARRNPALAVAAGALAGAAVSVKLLALPVVVPFAVLLVGWRSWRLVGAVAIGAGAVWAGLLIAYAGALPELWHRSSPITGWRASSGRRSGTTCTGCSSTRSNGGRRRDPRADRPRLRGALHAPDRDARALRLDRSLGGVPRLPAAALRPPHGVDRRCASRHGRDRARRRGRAGARSRHESLSSP